MPEGKTINLLGVAHHPRYAKEVKSILEKELKPGQIIGLEITPSYLPLFEKIYKSHFIPGGKYYESHLIPERKYFFYDLMVFAKQKGAKIVALDSDYGLSKATALKKQAKTFKERWHTGLLALPARERFMASRIIKSKPDFVVVGAGHLKEIENLLRKQGIKTKTIYRGMVRTQHPLATAARLAYWWRKKKKKTRFEKLARKKPH